MLPLPTVALAFRGHPSILPELCNILAFNTSLIRSVKRSIDEPQRNDPSLFCRLGLPGLDRGGFLGSRELQIRSAFAALINLYHSATELLA
jgi:hypothetical protein